MNNDELDFNEYTVENFNEILKHFKINILYNADKYNSKYPYDRDEYIQIGQIAVYDALIRLENKKDTIPTSRIDEMGKQAYILNSIKNQIRSKALYQRKLIHIPLEKRNEINFNEISIEKKIAEDIILKDVLVDDDGINNKNEAEYNQYLIKKFLNFAIKSVISKDFHYDILCHYFGLFGYEKMMAKDLAIKYDVSLGGIRNIIFSFRRKIQENIPKENIKYITTILNSENI